jgi:hypothetical protein
MGGRDLRDILLLLGSSVTVLFCSTIIVSWLVAR